MDVRVDSPPVLTPPGRQPGLSRAAELIRVHYRFQLGAFISEMEESADSIRVWSDVSPVPMWNHAAWLGEGQGDWRAFLEGTCVAWPRKNRPPVVYFVDRPDPQPQSIFGSGFARCDQESWMIFAGEDAPKLDGVASLDVRVAGTESELADFEHVFHAAYQTHGSRYGQVFRARTTEPERRTFHYVGYADGAPVCIATIVAQDQHACIYNVGTLPQARKRGLAAQLLVRLIGDAVVAGWRELFLQAETGSGAERLYLRLGFVTQFTRTGYRAAEGRSSGAAGVTAVWTTPAPAAHQQFLAALHREVDGRAERDRAELEVPCGLAWLAQVEATATTWRVSPVAIWASAWAVLLHRYSQAAEVAFGIRLGEAAAREVRVSIPQSSGAHEWVQRLHQQIDDLWPSPALPAPAWESVLECAPAASAAAAEDHAPLSCALPNHSNARVGLAFNKAQFEAGDMARVLQHWINLVDDIVRRPGIAVEALELLCPGERTLLLGDWSHAGQADATACDPIPRLFEAQTARQGAAVALEVAGAETSPRLQLTYEELNQRANRLAHRVQRLGIGPEKVVGLCLDRSLEMIVALLAIWKAGGVCLPLDPGYPRERLELMLSDSGAVLVICQERTLSIVPSSGAQLLPLEREAGTLEQEPADDLPGVVHLDHAAYVIYTSGSTGRPKGVVITHAAMAQHGLEAARSYALTRADRVLQFNSLSFDAAFEQIIAALVSGATLVLRGPEVWTSKEFARYLEEYALTVVDLPTAYWSQLLHDWSEHSAVFPRHLPRLIIVGGEAMSPDSLALWRRLPLHQVRLINAYGPTETTITATAFEVTPEFLANTPRRRVPIGRPRGLRRVYVLDERQRLVPPGLPGELCIGGPLLARGYFNRPELTEQKFVADRFGSPGARLYRTGDLVRFLPDGNLEFLGRVDEQVKIRGYRVELGEIEELLRQHRDVREAAVVLKRGVAHPFLAAFFVPKDGAPVSIPELREFLKLRLPGYMVPATLERLAALPLSPAGKVDRRKLEELAPVAVEAPVTRPRNPLELQLQLLFERILQRRNVGVDVSFFELGGDSLQALELIVEVERMTGRSLPLETLFRAPTIEGLARLLEAHQPRISGSSLVTLQSGGARPPFFLVHTTPGDVLGYGNLIYHLDRDQPCYGFQSAGLLRTDAAHQRVEDMATHYARLLRTVQPTGPYYLGGWCYGGLVALEMARRLLADGERVAFLGLLETIAPPPSLWVCRYYWHRLGCFLRMRPGQWKRYLQKKREYRREVQLANKMRFRRLEKKDEAPSARLEEHNRKLAQLEHVYSTNMRALEYYKPQPYPGKVTLFNAAQADAGIIRDPLGAWPGLARQIEVHTVPGDHDTMLTEPNVAVLARTIDACLRRAQADAAR